jgi:hypothetical protein
MAHARRADHLTEKALLFHTLQKGNHEQKTGYPPHDALPRPLDDTRRRPNSTRFYALAKQIFDEAPR